MDCSAARDLLQEELDGRLAPADAARLAEHVASCAACAKERRDLASLRATFRATPRPVAPSAFKDDVMAALPKGRVRNLPRTVGWLAMAAAAAFVAFTLIRPATTRVAERDVAAARAPDRKATRQEARAKATEKSDSEAESSPDDVAVPGAPAPAPAATPPAAEAMRLAEKKAADARVEAEASPAVRYVVFRDAAAADQFAKDLAAEQAQASKDKGAASGRASRRDQAGALADEWRGAPADLAAEAARSTRRVVARTAVVASTVETDVAAAVARAGGRLVAVAETPKFAAVVEPTAPPRANVAPPPAAAAKADDHAAPGAEAARKPSEGVLVTTTPPRITVVVVVLEPAPR